MPGIERLKRTVLQFLRHQKYRLIVIIGFSLLQSCDKQLPLGLDFVESEPLHIFSLDTVTVNFSTVYLDSIVTSGSGRLLLGYHQDSLLGEMKSQSYFHISRDSVETPDPDYSKYQEAVFRLYYDDYWYYDTTKTLTYSLFLLDELLETNEETGYLYNTSQFTIDSIDGFLGKITFTPRPHQDYVEFPIDYAFGDTLFQSVVDEEDFLTDDDDFREKYRGFALVPDESEGAFIGFNTYSSLILKYIEGGEDEEIVFNIGDELLYNQISNDRSGSLIKDLSVDNDILDSEKTEDMAFMRGGSALGIRVEFPYLHNLLQLSKDVYITQAYLEISPVYRSENIIEPYPSTYTIEAVDKLNRSYGEIGVSPTLYLDLEYKEDTYYRISVASYLNQLLPLNEDRGDALLLQLPESAINKSISRLLIGNSHNDFKSQLKILVLTLDQDEL